MTVWRWWRVKILREQMRAVSRQGLAAEELAIVGGDVMDARRRVEGLMQPAVDVDPPQLAGPVAPQWGLAENIRAGDCGLDPMPGDRIHGHAGIRFQPRAVTEGLIAVRGHGDGVFELDEAPSRMRQCGLNRDDHPGFQRRVGVVGGIGNGAARGQTRRFVADDAHAVGDETHLLAVRGLAPALRSRRRRFRCR